MPFRVLAIDGGGIRGIIPGAVLADLERRLAPKALADAFDLIVGTSTGGIIALALAVPDGERPRHRMEELLDLYLTEGETIFPGGGAIAFPARERRGRVRSMREGARYPVDGLEAVLARYLGDVPLRAALTDVVVTSYDVALREPVMLSSRQRPGAVCDVSMAVAARATSAGPTYFPPQPVRDGNRERILVDGGVYVNNPAVVGYLLGAASATQEVRPLALVSLGTGMRAPSQPAQAGLPADARFGDSVAVARTLLEAVATGTGRLVDQLLADFADGERFRYWRLQTTVEPCSYTMDDSRPENVRCLNERARDLVTRSQSILDEIGHVLTGTARPT
jgi:predicted acylesterase/phospholipase RssA